MNTKKNINNIGKKKSFKAGNRNSDDESYNQLSETAKKNIEEKIQIEVDKALQEMSNKKNDSLELELRNKNLLDKLELDALLNLNVIDTSDYKNNQKYFKDTIVGDNSNSDITRMWLMHLIGGGMLASHFINKNGTLINKKTIEKDILRLTSWNGTTLNDNFLHERIGKTFNYYLLKSALVANFIKKIVTFIKSWVYYIASVRNTKSGLIKVASLGSTLLVIYSGALDNFPAMKYLEKIPGVDYLLEKIGDQQTENQISSISKAILSYTTILALFSFLISLYDSFYYTIERDQIKKYLNEGIDESTKTRMFIFKDSFLKFDQNINHLESKDDEFIINKLNKAHIKNQKESGWFNQSNSFGKKIYDLLIDQLKKDNREDFYKKIRDNVPIIPYAIYFFNQKGEPRSVRQSICAIIVGLENIDSDTFKELRNYDIILEKRQKDLRSYRGGKSIKKLKNIKKKKYSKKNL